MRRTPSGPARIAAWARPMNKPCSITPGIAESRLARACGSAMRCNWASSSQCPPSVTKAWPFWPWRNIAGPGHPSSATTASTLRRVTVAPNGAISIGSGKRPSVATNFDASAMTIIFADADATIFSRSNAPPPPLIKVRSGPISSAPSTVRSSSGVSSRVVRAMPSAGRLRARGFRGRDGDDVEPRPHPLAQQVDEVPGGRSGAEPKAHARAHEIDRPRGGRPFFSFYVGRHLLASRIRQSYLAAFPRRS